MRNRYIFILVGIVCLFFACSKDPGVSTPSIPEPISPAYLQRIIYSKDNGQTVITDTVSGWLASTTTPNLPAIYANLRFVYDSSNRVSIIYSGSDPYKGTSYRIFYDSNGLPISGLRVFSYSAGSSYIGGDYAVIDTIRYRTFNGQVTGISFYNRCTITHEFNFTINNFVSVTTYAPKDTIDRYAISYQGINFTKIHSEGPSGKIVDLEYNYGAQKSPLIDSKSKFLVAPDLLLPSGYIYAIWHASNELLSYKKTFVTENNRVELSTFGYTYSSTHYPLTALAIDSGIAVSGAVNNGKYSMKFIYK